MKKVANKIGKIVEQLNINLESRLKRFGEKPALNSMALFLDTKSYDVFDSDEIFNHVSSLAVRFHDIIKANGCNTGKPKSGTEILYKYVKKFLHSKSPNNIWPHLFSRGKALSIENVLHLAETSVLPTSNAETERAFSFLWPILSKERQSLKNVN